jgi:cytochrome o ubiquinol oxidase operon protein cyoD
VEAPSQAQAQGRAPGPDPREQHGARSYLIGLMYAVVLTLASFWAASTSTVYAPAVPVLLAVLAIAQMGVHLTFFLHISSAPDQTNNFLALAFGLFVSGLVIAGSLIIMSHLNYHMLPMDELMKMQR